MGWMKHFLVIYVREFTLSETYSFLGEEYTHTIYKYGESLNETAGDILWYRPFSVAMETPKNTGSPLGSRTKIYK